MHRRRLPIRRILALTAALALLTCREAPRSTAPTATLPPVVAAFTPISGEVFVGAGDIARCSGTNDEATAALLDGFPGTVFTIGDNVQGNSTITPDFTNCYDPSWGRHKARTHPAPGHMEYWTTGAASYFNYFGTAAGDPTKGYYSYDLGAWHVIVLNTQLATSAGSPQELWLKADLAASTKQCTVAIWHLPRFSSSGTAVRSEVKPLWDDLYAAGADLVLNAHYELYERFAPQTPDGVADAARGIRQFTVGTGGIGSNTFSTIQPNSEARSTGTPGVLKLTLGNGQYTWEFIPIAGRTFTDAGSGNCVGTSSAPVATVTVSPSPAGVGVGQTVQLSAVLKDADGNVLSNRTITWGTSDATIATVNGTGLVTGVAVGSATITATSEGQSGTSVVTVIAGAVAGSKSTVTAAPTSITTGTGTSTITVTARDTNSNPISGATVALAATGSGNTLTQPTATTDANGVATGTLSSTVAGAKTVSATINGTAVTQTATVTVTDAPVASVTVTPTPASVQVGQTVQLTATPKDANGNPLTGRTVTWATSNAALATVSPTGLVSGGFAGDVTVTATSEGANGTAAVTVTGSSAILVGAGDIASCTSSGDEATADLLDGIPGTVFTAGDDAYQNGSATDFANCYNPTWGRHKARTRPTPGNHEYQTAGAAGYFGYFGAAAGDPTKGYYSYDLGEWHIVVLNNYVPMTAGSTQELWLRADLAASTRQCTIGMWHEPTFSDGPHGNVVSTLPLWNALYDGGADIVLVGHDHLYERFAPQRGDGSADPAFGIREFLVGTGGESHDGFHPSAPNLEARIVDVYGVLKLTLQPGGYTWQFVPQAGQTATDQGSGSCHGGPPPVANPGGPYAADGVVTFNGSASFDPQGDTPLTYAWDFGDGTSGTGATPAHSYGTNGVYTVTLVVTDSKGNASAPTTTTATIANQPPAVNAGPDWAIMPGGTVNLSATFSDSPSDSPWSYTISWGDGSPGETGSVTVGSVSSSHTYATVGQYTLQVSVTDQRGAAGSDNAIVNVSDETPPEVFVGAGDIARCDGTNDEATAALLDNIPGTVFTIGDNVQGNGTITPDFINCYDPSWGRHKARTHPAPGHKEYWISGASTYFNYFGAAAGDPAKGYYSYDLGAWHIVVLNTQLSTSAGSAQELWLKADLAASTKQCTVAIWHLPRFSSAGTAVRDAVKPLWDDLYAAGADLVLNAHDEVYERFAPQTPAGVADPARGLRQFTVGTGGIGSNTFSTTRPNSEARSTGTPGVLKLTLTASGYAWQFVPIAGRTYTDSGSGSCH